MTINYKKLGQKLKRMRVKNNLTQEKLAELCDVSVPYISMVETGQRRISSEKLEIFSKYLNFEINIIDKNNINLRDRQEFLNKLINLIQIELGKYNIN